MEIVYKIAIEMGVLCFLGGLYYLYQKRKINSYVGIEKEKLILILIQLTEKKVEDFLILNKKSEEIRLLEKLITDLKSILEKKNQYLNHQDFIPIKKFLDETDPIIELLNEGYTHLFYEKKD